MHVSDRRLGNIFFVVFIDLLGFGLILPLLPFYAEAYGASILGVGLLVASYAAAQLVGAPILGRLSDRYGRRPILLISILGTVAGFVLLAVAEPLGIWLTRVLFGTDSGMANATILALLFASRIIDGLTGGNISVAQAYIADITDESNRARGLGLIGAAFGLGFIIGPALGGTLSLYGYAVPAVVAAALASLNWLGVLVFLPESLTEERRQEIEAADTAPFSVAALLRAFRRPRVAPLLNVRFLFGLAFSMFQTIFAIYAAGEPLQLSAQATGYVLTYVGLLAVLVQGVAIGRLTSRFSEVSLMLWAALLMAVAFVAWGLTPNLLILLIVLAPLSLGGGVLNTVINSLLSKAVRREEVGGTLGISSSVESLTRVISPTVGGYLLGQFGALAPGLFCAVVMGIVAVFVWRRISALPNFAEPGVEATAG